MFQEFWTSLTEVNAGINLLQVGASIAVAVVLGVIVYFAHKFTTDEFVYDKDFGLVCLMSPDIAILLCPCAGRSGG